MSKAKVKPDYSADLAAFNPVVQPVAIGLKNEAQERPAPAAQGSDMPTAPRAAPAARKRAAAHPKPQVKPEKQPPAPEPAVVYPWESADPRVPKVFNLRFDEVTWTQLKFLGDTTYGQTMHSIAMAAVKQAIADQLRARGIAAPK